MTEDSVRPLGEWLRQRREHLGISLEQAEQDTRIRGRFLEALETEELEGLPDPVVGRGFLRNYAAYLELDPEEAIDRYSAFAGPSEPDPLPVGERNPFESGSFRPVPLHEMPSQQRLRWWLPAALVVVLLAALALLAWWNYPAIPQWLSSIMPATEPSPAALQPTKIALATATHTGAATATETVVVAVETPTQPAATLEPTIASTPTPTLTPSPPPTPTDLIYTGIFLELVFTDTSWIQVTVDGVREFQGELQTDTYRSWYGEQRIELRTGNAGAVEATINGQKMGTLGATGEVVDQVFEVVNNQVAAATPTREPTLSPVEQTATAEAPAPTSTVTPTATIAPTSEVRLTARPTVVPTSLSTVEAPAVAETPVIHVVKLDDNLYNISLAYGTTVDAIKQANGLESDNLRVGQELIIPQGTVTPLPTPTTAPATTLTP